MPDIASNGTAQAPRVLVLACGALAREILAIVRLNGWGHVTLECLPAKLHHVPDQITPAIERRLDAMATGFDHVLIGYGDCGTGGRLDALLARYEAAERLPGAHCYEFFATSPVFAELHEAELGTFYLTDFLVRHFDRFVYRYLGLDRHPELRDTYFGNYRKVVYLSQLDDEHLLVEAHTAAERLGLAFEHVRAGYGDLERRLVAVAGPAAPAG